MKPLLAFLEQYKEYGVIFIRLMIGFHLAYGVHFHILDSSRMDDFVKFLGERSVPVPLFSASLSVYGQFICGILFILGAATRYAAVIMIINFITAIVIAHIGDSYQKTFPALMMLSASCFFLLHGAGRLSVDYALTGTEKRS